MKKFYFLFLSLVISHFTMANSIAPNDSLSSSELLGEKDPVKRLEFFRFDSLSNDLAAFEPIEVTEDLKQLLSVDPVKFSLTTEHDSVQIGEEIEIKIAAQFLDIHPSLLFSFEGSNEYSLKVMMPKGFVVTGGSYYDYILGKVDKHQPTKEYTIKGFYEYDSEDCFKLLRGSKLGNQGLFVLKDELCLGTDIRVLSNSTFDSSSEKSGARGILDFCDEVYTRLTFDEVYISSTETLDRSKVSLSLSCYRSTDFFNDNRRDVNSIVGGIIKVFHVSNGISTEVAQFTASQINNGSIEVSLPTNFKPGDNFYCEDSQGNKNTFSGNFERKWNTDKDCSNTSIGILNNYRIQTFGSVSKNYENCDVSTDADYTVSTSFGKGFYRVHFSDGYIGSWRSIVNNPSFKITRQLFNQNIEVEVIYANYAEPDFINVLIPKSLNTSSFQIYTSKEEVCSDEQVRLSLTLLVDDYSCQNGNLTWFKEVDGQFISLGSGNYKDVTGPGVYQANCWTSCDNEDSNLLTITERFPPSQPQINISNTPQLGGATLVTVTNCPSPNSITWNKGTVNESYGPRAFLQEGAYEVVCSNSCGDSPKKSFTIGESIPRIASSDNSLCVGETSILTTRGCFSSSQVTYEKLGATSSWEFFSISTNIGDNFSLSNVTEGTYRSYCGGSSSANSRRAAIPVYSSSITISSSTAPLAPVITAEKLDICGSDVTSLTATGCSSAETIWSTGETGESISVSSSGTYTARCEKVCGSSELLSPVSNALTINYSAVCDCNSIVVTTNVPNDEVIEGKRVVITATPIDGATYVWNIPTETGVTVYEKYCNYRERHQCTQR